MQSTRLISNQVSRLPVDMALYIPSEAPRQTYDSKLKQAMSRKRTSRVPVVRSNADQTM